MSAQFLAKKRVSQKGFTIIELMIATLVFSVILLIVTGGIIQVTRTYYKGVTESNTLATARNIVNTIGQAIQFDGGIVQPTTASPAAGTTYAFCIGNNRFQYFLGTQLSTSGGTGKTYHALLQDTSSACAAGVQSSSINASGLTGTELVNPKMRLSALSVTNVSGNLYTITVRVIYGDDSLLSNPTAANAACKGVVAGEQFCAVSQLSTTVVKRVQ